MKENITVQELANIWQVTVNTTWKRLNRIQKELKEGDERLIISKKMVNNREITVITIADDILNKFTVNNPVNNSDYEELLTDNNGYNPVNNSTNSVNTQDLIDRVMDYSEQMNITVNNIHNDYTQRLLTVQEELLKEKSKIPLLEDKAGREGLYLQEIKELKENHKNKMRVLTALLIGLFVIWVITVSFLIYLLLNPRTVTHTETIIKEVPKEVIKYVKK